MNLLFALIVGLHLCPSSFALDHSEIGRISFISGDVRVGDEKATLNQKISEGTLIKTFDQSLAIVTLGDESKIKINPGSSVSIDQPHLLTLKSGSLFSKIQKQIGSKPKFQIRTRAAILGVRGTEFFTAYSQKKLKEEDLWMCVNEGEVSVESTIDSKSVIVKKGEGVVVPVGKAVTDPKPYSWTKNLNWNMQPEEGDLFDHTSLDSMYKDLLNQYYD